MIVDAIRRVADGHDLTTDQAMEAMEEIMTGQATDAQIAALVTALRMKGESDDEIVGFAQVMREHSLKVKPKSTGLIDTCGTGGDGVGTFNISTAAAIVVAAAGGHVAKHGNRSISSKCGSADVLEHLGVNINIAAEEVAGCVDEVGVGFMFAPNFHPAMKYAAGPRREIGIRTVFNMLGPLTNPAGAEYQLVGVYDEELTAPIARVLGELGCKRALVVHGTGGVDEISLLGPTLVSELRDGQVRTSKLHPEDFGSSAVTEQDIKGGDPADCAQIIDGIFSGKVAGPRAELVSANAGAAIYVAGMAGDLAEGTRMAREALSSGKAKGVLDNLIAFTSGNN